MKKLSSLLVATSALTVVLAAIAPAYALTIIKAPPKQPHHHASTQSCSNELGYLRRVYEEEVGGIERVSVVPVCENEDYGVMRSDGNAGAIRQALGDNDDVQEALQAANFGIEDVIGVLMTGDESAVIYVHPFLYR